MNEKVLVMGVSGCGKSTLARHLGDSLGCVTLEGDDFHSPASQAKMAAGVPLQDDDRWPWLERLGQELQRHQGGAVLACSALKARYRQLLRAAVPDLQVVYLHIGPDEAHRRVASRVNHLFPAALVDSQFEALEAPCGEASVLRVEATDTLQAQLDAVRRWLGRHSSF
jgi:gluconokinase